MVRRVCALSAVFIVAAFGCVETTTVRCGDFLCPGGKVCDPTHSDCVFPEQLSSCDGVADGEPCAFPGSINGRCRDGVCQDAVCGNGTRELDEVCDDGNTISGDECSADCRSNESCGNGIIDEIQGEQCDDGEDNSDGEGACHTDCRLPICADGITDPNEACDDGNNVDGDGCNAICSSDETCGNGWTDFPIGEQCDDGDFVNHDGCTSVCSAELPLWDERTARTIPGMWQHQMAYDAARDRVVMFGGVDPVGIPVPAVRELVGNQWINVDVPERPPPRTGHMLVYDAARRLVMTFGGGDPPLILPSLPPEEPVPFGDTWVYDGTTWVDVTPTAGPGARRYVAGAYHASAEHVVMFGGEDDDAVFDETWVWDGTSWTERQVSGPPARSEHIMAYDAGRDRTVLFGGNGSDGMPLSDTWEWDGTSWTEVVTTGTPASRSGMAYHAGLGRVVVYGPVPPGPMTPFTWQFDGTDWSPILGPPPQLRFGVPLVYHAGRDQVLTFAGTFQPNGGPTHEDLWALDAGGWQEVPLVVAPSARVDAVLSFDSLRRELLFHSGRDSPMVMNGQTYNDVWVWRGNVFEHRPTLNTPPATTHAFGFVFDEARGVSVMVRPGGNGDPFETWELAGAVWRRVITPTDPAGRGSASVVYDSARERVIVFGGSNSGANRDDTWEYDGSDWVQVETPSKPPARRLALMAYDVERGITVLFGGRGDDGPLDDTWVYDGSDWTELDPPEHPSARFRPGMVYNPRRKRVMIVQGDPGPILDDWEFDGETWIPLTEPLNPGVGARVALGYDGNDNTVVRTHGEGQQTETWVFNFSSTVADEMCRGGEDEDGDGLVDCDDLDCDGQACGPGALLCVEQSCVCSGGATEALCGDGFDEDCDGLVDCADDDCQGSAECSAESDCGDGSDDDGDFLTDCADPGCVGVGVCEAYETTCGDGEDNDGDGAVDCADLDCFLNPCTMVTP